MIEQLVAGGWRRAGGPSRSDAGVIYAVLGPLAAWRGGVPVALPPPTGRRLLQAFVLADGDPLRPDQLALFAGGVDWDRHPSRLHVALSRLRSWLTRHAGAGARLHLTSAGYRLELGPDVTDVALFRRWYAAAKAAEGDAQRVELAARALAIWRGEPVPDAVDELRTDPTVAALQRDRLDAACLLTSAALPAGLARQALPHVLDLARANPLDERLQAAAARLLAADSRQADALKLLDDTTARLADELGIDPGGELRETRLRILRQQEEPAVRAAEVPRYGRWPSTARMIGRVGDRTAVDQLLDRNRLVTVVGTGGVGKTTFAVDLADRLAGRYPGGVAFLALDEVADADGLGPQLDEVLTAQHSPPGKPFLLVLDNCEHLLEPVARVIDRLLAENITTTVLATSRRAFGLPQERVWRLEGLIGTPERVAEAASLFAAKVEAAGHPVPTGKAAAAAVGELCRRLDGLPLALVLAADLAAVLAPAELLERIGDPSSPPLVAASGTPRHRSLEACTEWSYRLLNPAERTLLHRLAIFPDHFSARAAGAVCGGGGVSVNAVVELHGLVAHHLVLRHEDADERMYQLPYGVRQFARYRFAASAERSTVYDRYLDSHLE